MQRIFAKSLFNNKVAIVTGGGTGIGMATAKGFVELGGKVVIAGRDKARIDEGVEKIKTHCAEGAEVLGLQCNIRKREEVSNMVTDTIDKFGRLDGLVNNGGGQFWSPAENISPGGFHAVVDTNLKGSWNCMQEAYHQYMGENGGKIVNIVLMSEMGLAGMSHSAAAREAVKNLAITLGAEWAGNNIQINCVAPGIFPSETAVAAYGEQSKEIFDKSALNVPKKRLGDLYEGESLSEGTLSLDLIPQILFNLTDAVQYTTGQTTNVCGGITFFNNYLKGANDITAWMEERGINMG